jgi:hypothetical protein
MMTSIRNLAITFAAVCAIATASAAGPSYVDITWMSIANIYYEIGSLGILTDGYFSRIPQSEFYGGGGGLAQTRKAFQPDVEAVSRVLNALGGPSKVNLLLTGHSQREARETGSIHRQVAARSQRRATHGEHGDQAGARLRRPLTGPGRPLRPMGFPTPDRAGRVAWAPAAI